MHLYPWSKLLDLGNLSLRNLYGIALTLLKCNSQALVQIHVIKSIALSLSQPSTQPSKSCSSIAHPTEYLPLSR